MDSSWKENDFAEFVSLHNAVKASGLYNFQSCRIPLKSKLIIPFWRDMLKDYCDLHVCDYLEFGWPVGHLGTPVESSCGRNHKGATDYPKDIRNYLKKEIAYGAVMGPFKSNPFQSSIALSPLNSVPKKDTDERRVIVDLSFPQGKAVNDGILKDQYLNEEINIRYPTVDDLVDLIKKKGKSCHLFKRDLKRAYRQIFIDPGDVHLMGYKWKGHMYFDTVLTMGLRSAAYICMQTTSAIRYMCEINGFEILNYLDDLAGCEIPGKSKWAFDCLGELLKKCGIEESKQKAEPPTTKMIFLGILFDTESLTLSIDHDRLLEILELVSVWLTKSSCSKKQLQSLIGKLNFVSQCVRPGRIFISRLLNWLREMPENGTINIPLDFKSDLRWWFSFLPLYNGVSMMAMDDWTEPDQVFAVDSCLTGCGGWMNGKFFHRTFPDFILSQNLHINQLEMLTIVIALKLWGELCKHKRVVIYCDNLVSVRVLNTGSSRNLFLQSCLREVCFIAATHQFEIKAIHLEGRSNRVPDLLSRWDQDLKYQQEFYSLMKDNVLSEQVVPSHFFQFIHDW